MGVSRRIPFRTAPPANKNHSRRQGGDPSIRPALQDSIASLGNQPLAALPIQGSEFDVRRSRLALHPPSSPPRSPSCRRGYPQACWWLVGAYPVRGNSGPVSVHFMDSLRCSPPLTSAFSFQPSALRSSLLSYPRALLSKQRTISRRCSPKVCSVRGLRRSWLGRGGGVFFGLALRASES